MAVLWYRGYDDTIYYYIAWSCIAGLIIVNTLHCMYTTLPEEPTTPSVTTTTEQPAAPKKRKPVNRRLNAAFSDDDN